MTHQEIEQKRQDADRRQRIKRLFSENPEVRADAVDALKDCWGYDLPAFRTEELANCPSENCTIMAARRDGQKEMIDWLLKL